MIPVFYNLVEQVVNSVESQTIDWHLRLGTDMLPLSAMVFDFHFFFSGLKVLQSVIAFFGLITLYC